MKEKHPAEVLADKLRDMVCVHPQTTEDEPSGYDTVYDQLVDAGQEMLRTIPQLEAEIRSAFAERNALQRQLEVTQARCQQIEAKYMVLLRAVADGRAMQASPSFTIGVDQLAIEAARIELEAYREDAERHRWLRSRITGAVPMVRIQIMRRGQYVLIERDLDKVVDAARND